MEQALELARKGTGYVNPNPLVGAVIVNEGEVVGTGYHKKYGGPHAEVFALDEAGDRASGAEIYLTLEPCVHYGKTPPCVDRIIESGITRAIIATIDPNPRVKGKGVDKLKEAGVDVQVGLIAEEAERLNEIYFHYIRTGKPFVLLKLAQSIDGKIATRTGDSKWLSGESSLRLGHRLRSRYSAVAVGGQTVAYDDPQLTTRLVEGPDPARIVLNSRNGVSADAKIFDLTSPSPTIIVSTENLGEEKRQTYRSKGAVVWEARSSSDGHVDLKWLLGKMASDNYDSLLVEGGGELAWSFIRQGFVDKFLFVLTPRVLGGNEAVGSVGGEGFESVEKSLGLRDVSVSRSGPDYVYRAYPQTDQ